MSRSLDFCRVVASDPDLSDLAHKNWRKAGETESEPVFDEQLHGERALVLSDTDQSGSRKHCGVRVVFDPDANFEYFTSASSIIYEPARTADMWKESFNENMKDCVDRILYATTYDIRVGRPEYGNIVCYTIGNFVCLGEDDKDSNVCETTVLLPLKMRILPEGMM